jgi:hypothetical protein
MSGGALVVRWRGGRGVAEGRPDGPTGGSFAMLAVAAGGKPPLPAAGGAVMTPAARP